MKRFLLRRLPPYNQDNQAAGWWMYDGYSLFWSIGSNYNSYMPPILSSHIEIRKNRAGLPRAYIAGTRVHVQDIYVCAEVQGNTPEEIVAGRPHLTLGQVHAALAYYFDNRQAILDEIRQDDEFVTSVRAQTGPGPLEKKLNGTDADDAFSPG